jgi:hypothetical protein
MSFSEMFKIVPSPSCPPDRAYMLSYVRDDREPFGKRLSAAVLKLDNAEVGGPTVKGGSPE